MPRTKGSKNTKEQIRKEKEAQRKLNNEDIKIEFEDSEKIKEMQNLLKDVKEYNIQKAKKLISEAILDLNYINEKSTDICSLRLGYIKNSKEER